MFGAGNTKNSEESSEPSLAAGRPVASTWTKPRGRGGKKNEWLRLGESTDSEVRKRIPNKLQTARDRPIRKKKRKKKKRTCFQGLWKLFIEKTTLQRCPEASSRRGSLSKRDRLRIELVVLRNASFSIGALVRTFLTHHREGGGGGGRGSLEISPMAQRCDDVAICRRGKIDKKRK